MIRRLRSCDWEAWRAVRLEALADAPADFGSTLAEWCDATPERWQARLRDVPFNVIAVRDDVGVGQVGATSKTAQGSVELISMWVSPTVRGCGVGDALVVAVTSWAATAGASLVTLRVKTSNERARRLYERHGFVSPGMADTDGDIHMGRATPVGTIS